MNTITATYPVTGPDAVNVLFRILEDGAFVVAAVWAKDNRPMLTAYAYPTSPNAAAAKRDAQKVAFAMVRRGLQVTRPYSTAEYDARNMAKLGVA
ncbi:MAG TPA: hypothetical protein VEA41_07950 [Salinarimonas sp.]|nr:hypothetical protein [Salinarimonas sp.]